MGIKKPMVQIKNTKCNNIKYNIYAFVLAPNSNKQTPTQTSRNYKISKLFNTPLART